MPFYLIAIGLLKQTLEERLEGVRMESAMIRTTQLNQVWFTTVISLDHYILLVLSPSLFYSKKRITFLTTGGVTQEPPIPPPNYCTGTQTQPSVVDGTSSMPPNGAQAHTPDSMVEDGIFFIKFIPFFVCHYVSLIIYMAVLHRL